MAKKAGICRNIDCDNYKQVIEIEAGEEFECPLCHQPLEDADHGGSKGGKNKGSQGGPNLKLIGIIFGALLLLGGIGFGIYTLVDKLSGDSIPTAIKLDKKNITMKVGETIVLTPKAEPEGVKATFIFKKEKKEQSIKVSKGGEVKALKEGEAKVLIKCEENPNIRTICKITIVKDSVKSGPGGDGGTNPEPKDTLIQKITTKEQSITMTEGQTRYFSFRVEPETFNELLLISSSDANIAEFDKNSGNLIAKKAGTAIITLKGEQSGIAASVTVTVKKKPGGDPPGDGPVKLSYGTYKGETKTINGKKIPHGHGTVTFTTTRRIVSSQDYIAHPGDRYEGEWRNGVIAGGLGYWYHDGITTGIRP